MKPIAVALLLAAAAPSHGAEPAGPAPRKPGAADATAEAKARFRKGSELYKQARYREAIAEFEAAYRLRPHGIIYFNLAQCHERLGDIPAALQAYHEYLRAVPDAEDKEIVHAAMANLEARLGASGVQQLLLYSDPNGAEVLVDGHSKGRTPMALVLPHGNHSVTFLKQGYRTTSRPALLSPQSSLELDVVLQKLGPGEQAVGPGSLIGDLPPPALAPPVAASGATAPAAAAAPTAPTRAPSAATAPPPKPREEPKKRLWTWVAAGAAGAALAAGGYYGLQARSAERDFLAGKGEPNAMQSKARSNARTANVLYGVGGALGAGACALFFVEGSF